MATLWESADALASTSTSYSLVPGNQLGGGVSVGGDRDWIKVILSAGYGYGFTIEGDDSRGPRLSSAEIQLRNADGTINGSADDLIGLNTLAAGTYYLDAGHAWSSSATGNYLIKSFQEVAANTLSRQVVSVGGSYQGGIDYGGDRDWLKVGLVAGNAYVFRVVGDDSSGAAVSSPRIQLRNPDGTTNGGVDDIIGFTASATGSHFLDVHSSYSGYSGNYRLEVVQEVASSSTTGAVMVPGGTYQGTVDYRDDHDWVKVSLVAGQTYIFQIEGDDSAGNGVSYPYLQVRNPDGTTNGGRDDLIVFMASRSGVHYLEADGGSSSGGDYLISSAIDLAGNSGTSLTINQIGVTSQVIDYAGDRDWIEVQLIVGVTYKVSLRPSGANGLEGSSIVVRNAAGNELELHRTSDLTNSFDFTAPRSGSFYLDVGAYYSYDNGAYRLTLTPEKVVRKGTAKADTISGYDGSDEISGLGGNDVVKGLGGDDLLFGGAGKDRLSGKAGHDLADGGGGNDVIVGGAGDDTLVGGGGKDVLRGQSGDDFLAGGAGGDKLYGQEGDDVLQGGSGDDLLDGGRGRDTADYTNFGGKIVIDLGGKSNKHKTKPGGTDTFKSIENATGGSGNDKLSGNGNANTLSGSDGNDKLFGKGGSDILVGGDGNDLLDPGSGKGERLVGGAGNDRYLLGTGKGKGIVEDSLGDRDAVDAGRSSSAAKINLGTGKSSTSGGQKLTLEAGGTSTLPLDLVFLQDLSGSFGSDIAKVRDLAPKIVNAVKKVNPLSGFGAVGFVDKPTSPFGGSADYVYKLFAPIGTGGAKTIKDAYEAMSIQSGSDTPEAQLEALLQVAKRADGEVGYRGDSMRVVVLFTNSDFHVAGDGKAAGIKRKNDGDDVVEGDGTVEDYPSIGMTRAALVDAGIFPIFATADHVMDEYQTLVKQLGFGGVVSLDDGSTNVVAAIKKASKLATRTSIEDALGSRFGDDIKGSAVDNLLKGNAGDDLLQGLAGNDTLRGDAGSDKMVGGAGKDILVGGTGADWFVYRTIRDSTKKGNGRDKVLDFRAGEGDKLDLRALDARARSGKDDAFTFIGSSKFSKKAGELRFEQKAKSTFVYGDVNGDKKADFAVELAGKIDLGQGDFFL